jgi:pSer/pThr/pTyr-binding forkhead associated (FHA) protein
MNNVRWFFKKAADGQEVEISATLTVGRLDNSGLVLKERSASSRHAELTLSDGALFVTDLGSTNGTFVNGTQLAAKVRTRVNPGDRVRFDVEEFDARMVAPPAQADDNRTILRELPAEAAKTVLVERSSADKPPAPPMKPAPAPVAAPAAAPAAKPAPAPAPAAAPAADKAAPAGDIPGGWDVDKGAGTVLIDAPIRGGAVGVDDGASAEMSVPFLYVASGKREKQRIRLVSDESGKSAWSIGSRADQTIQFDDEGVSAEHAKLSTDGQRWVLTDRISANGTYVNDKRVPMAWLSPGDRLRFGPVECVFHIPRSARMVSAPAAGGGGKRSRLPIFIAVGLSFLVTLVVIYFLFRRH